MNPSSSCRVRRTASGPYDDEPHGWNTTLRGTVNHLARLTPQQRTLLREADVPVLLPQRSDGSRIEAGAQTTTRAGRVTLMAFSARLADDALEVMTLARESLMASIPPAERSEAADRAFMREYLEREAASALAMRTLELAEGAAHTLTTPLDRLIAARRAELPPPHAVDVHVDGAATPASCIAFGAHAATWADLPAHRAGFIVYGPADVDVPGLTAARA